MTLLLAPSGVQIAVLTFLSCETPWGQLRCPRCLKVQNIGIPTANRVAVWINAHDCRNDTWDGRQHL